MASTFSKFILPLILLLIAFSCQQERSTSPTPLLNRSVGVKEAYDWFKSQEKNRTARVASSVFGKLTPAWGLAQEVLVQTEATYVEVPVSLPQRTTFSNNFGSFESPTTDVQALAPDLKLVIYRNQAGELVSAIKDLIPESEYSKVNKQKTNNADYTGLMLLRDWNTGQLFDGFLYKNGKVRGRMQSQTQKKARTNGVVCKHYTYWWWQRACCTGSANTPYSCGIKLSRTISEDGTGAPLPGHDQPYEQPNPNEGCGSWELVRSEPAPSICEYVPDEQPNPGGPTPPPVNPGEPGGGNPYPSINDNEFRGVYAVDLSGDPVKKRIFKITGMVIVTNRCQHQALKSYLLKGQDLEVDQRNKIRQCGVQNNLSGDALERLMGGLTFAAVAEFMASNAVLTLRTAARGIIFGQGINNLNAAACIENVHGDIEAEIEKAYNAYNDAFNQPCQ